MVVEFMAKKRGSKRTKQNQFYDYTLLFVIVFLACFGLIMVYSTSYYTAQLKLNDGSYYLRHQARIPVSYTHLRAHET